MKKLTSNSIIAANDYQRAILCAKSGKQYLEHAPITNSAQGEASKQKVYCSDCAHRHIWWGPCDFPYYQCKAVKEEERDSLGRTIVHYGKPEEINKNYDCPHFSPRTPLRRLIDGLGTAFTEGNWPVVVFYLVVVGGPILLLIVAILSCIR